MNKLDLNIGDMLTSLDYWVKYDVGTQNHVFNKGNKYELIYYNKYYNSYTIKSEIYKYANENCNNAYLTEEEVMKHFDYKKIQRKLKLTKLYNL